MSGAPILTVAHASGLHAVGRQLAAMHQELLRQSGEEAREVRLSVLNLVAACTDVEAADVASQTVGLIAASHPARAIIIVADREGPAQIEADLSLQSAPTRHGEICAEQVRLTVGGEPARHLASVVTPLLVPDVPVYLWLVGAPPLEQAFGDEAIAICQRIIIDTGSYADAAAALRQVSDGMRRHQDGVALADLAWARTRRFRELVAQTFDSPETHRLMQHVTGIEVESSGRHPSSQAWLFAGWLASRLGWPEEGGPEVRVGVRGGHGLPRRALGAVMIHCDDGEHTGTVRLERDHDHISVAVHVEPGMSAERTLALSDPDTVHLVGGLLEEDTDDPIYPAALHRAAAMAAR